MAGPGHIYFIGALDRSLIKIGVSVDPRGRFHGLRNSSPTPLELLATVSGTVQDERKIHRVFLAHRSHGEWFAGVAPLLELINFVRNHGHLPENMRGASDERPVFVNRIYGPRMRGVSLADRARAVWAPLENP